MKKINTRSAIGLSCIATIAFFVLLLGTCGIWFETNDDVFIAQVLSGKATGTPDYHIPYVSALLTFPISRLYMVFPTIPWWGIYITGILAVSFGSMLYVWLKTGATWVSAVLMTVLGGCAVLTGLYVFGQAQFTSAAMLLAFAGYIVLCGGESTRKRDVIFVILELVACMTRDSAMMIAQPVGFLCFLGVSLSIEDGANVGGKVKKFIQKALKYGILVLAVVGVAKLSTQAMFVKNEWATYEKLDEASVYFMDYEQKIEYSQLEDILAKYDISAEYYEQFLNYRFDYTDYRFSAECVDEILKRLQKMPAYSHNRDGYVFFAGFLNLLFLSKEFFKIHRLAAALFALLAAVAIVNGNRKMLRTTALTFLGYIIGIAVLALRDRYVFRVMMPYYFGTILLLTYIACRFWASGELCGKAHAVKIKRTVSIAAVFLLLGIGGCMSGRNQFAYMRRQNNFVNTQYLTMMQDIEAYCNAHPDRTFIVDNSYARNISTPVYESMYYQPANYIYSGSWYAAAPAMIDAAKEYLAAGNTYYLVYEGQTWMAADGLDFYAGAGTHTETEKFKTSNGATMWVYSIK